MPDVFISYSRMNSTIAYQIRDALKKIAHPNGGEIDCWLDVEDIEFSVQWWQRICKGIEESSNFAIILSNHYLASEICNEEYQYAQKLGKPIIPILVSDVSKKDYTDLIVQRQTKGDWIRNPATVADETLSQVSQINYIVFPQLGMDKTIEAFVQSIFEDIDYKDRARNLLIRAYEWQNNHRNRSYLLTGTEITVAEEWRDNAISKQLTVEPIQVDYISVSRRASRQTQQRLLSAVSIALVIVLGLAILALSLFNQSESRLSLANDRGTLEAQAREEAEQNLLEALRVQSLFLADSSQQAFTSGDNQEAIGLALRAFDYYPQIFNQSAYEAMLNALKAPIREKFRYPHSDVRSVVISSDGQWVLSGAGDKTIQVTNIVTGETKFSTLTESIVYLAYWNLDETYIYVILDDGTIRTYDANTGEPVLDVQPPDRYQEAITSPDGRFKIELETIIDTKTGEQIGTIVDKDTFSWSLDSSRLVTTDREGAGRIYDVNTLTEVLFQTSTRVFEVAWSPDNTRFATYSRNAVVEVWDNITGQQLFRFEHPYESQTAFDNSASILKWSDDSTKLLTTSDSGYVVVWNLETGNAMYRLMYETFISDADWIGDESLIVLAIDSEVIVLSSSFHDSLDTMAYFEFPPEGRIMGIQLSKDGQKVLSYGSDETARIWDLLTGQSITTFPHVDEYMYALGGAVWNEDETKVLTWAPDSTVNIWDVGTGERFTMRHGDGFLRNVIITARWGEGEKTIISRDETGVEIVWDSQTGAKLSQTQQEIGRVDYGYFWNQQTNGQSASPDGRQIADWSQENDTIIIRDAESGQIIDTLNHLGVWGVVWAEISNTLVSFGEDNGAYIWNLSGDYTHRPHLMILPHMDGVRQIIFTPDSHHAITVGEDAKIHVWMIDMPMLIGLAQDYQTRPLNNEELNLAFLATAIPSPTPTASQTATYTPTLDLTQITATPFASDTPYPTFTPTPVPLASLNGDNFEEWLGELREQGVVSEAEQIIQSINNLELKAMTDGYAGEALFPMSRNTVVEARIRWSGNSNDEECGLSLLTDEDSNVYVSISRLEGLSLHVVDGDNTQWTKGFYEAMRVGIGEQNSLLVVIGEEDAIVYLNGLYSAQLPLDELPAVGWSFAMISSGSIPNTEYHCVFEQVNIWTTQFE